MSVNQGTSIADDLYLVWMKYHEIVQKTAEIFVINSIASYFDMMYTFRPALEYVQVS